MNLVLVEDHDVLRMMLQQALEEAGHRVQGLSCAEELDELTAGQSADLFLIDLNLPGEDGLQLTERVRVAYPLAGVIIISARSELQARVDGYARGADLYLTKPVEVEELCAAVAALGRRRQRVEGLILQPPGGELTLHQQSMTLRNEGREPVTLTASEVSLLAALSRAPGRRLSYWQIAEVLGLDLDTYPKASLEVRIVRLRKKLATAGGQHGCIESIRNHGYQLCVAVRVL